ncbi:uncharacterized protein VICG_00507 [Vittaforma corneae ATCC 50505]|uniref:DNA replication complex GINS protein SLD5 n=1 Tax=Vittaforma corneae (strain ATCC 50505) TaxID=993615 RepID=L2GND2_VITCO|nr:uncharacterized protein VICG_00507 [Vittaforma corneae ATCC 50505]ELA42408.1 hypothetical protein VICG_00507 [Vittaforma corneae ATCC 50505]
MLSLERLIQAYTNEKATEKLLPYDRIADEFNFIIKSHGNRNDSGTSLSNTFEEIEQERIKYFVKEYILTRLDKIRANFFIIQELMSKEERIFAEKYKEMMIIASVYVDKPSKVFEVVGFIAQRNLEAVRIDGHVVEILLGDFFVASYDDIASYIKDGSVALV